MNHHQVLNYIEESKKYEGKEEIIPKGKYCYNENYVNCPYFCKLDSSSYKNSVLCTFLESEELGQGRILDLWDMAKVCNINTVE